jgi:hypothetical protein
MATGVVKKIFFCQTLCSLSLLWLDPSPSQKTWIKKNLSKASQTILNDFKPYFKFVYAYFIDQYSIKMDKETRRRRV